MNQDAVSQRPCPDCGSTEARWRKRNPKDVTFTWLRFLFDNSIGKLFAPPSRGRPDVTGYGSGAGSAMQYDQYREVFEATSGTMTPRWFWSCPSCKHKGDIYDDANQARMDKQLGSLNSAGGQVGEQGGAIGLPNDVSRPGKD